ncbi:MAG: sugar phosphate isomerase/epimerase family protein [Candidatus Hydrothermarchaeota archaeon]
MEFLLGFKVHWRPGDIDEYLKIKPQVVELHQNSEDLTEFFEKQLSRLKKVINYNIDVLAVHVPEYIHKGVLVDLSSENERIKEKSIFLVQRTIKIGERLSKLFSSNVLIVIHPGGIYNEKIDKRILIKNFLESISFFSTNEVIMTLENLPNLYRMWNNELWQGNFILNAEDMNVITELHEFYLTFDISHAKLHCNYENKDLISYVEELKKWIVHIHASDARGLSNEGLMPNTGEVNFEEFFSKIKDLERNISVIPEILNGHVNGGLRAKKGYYFLKNIIEGIH